MIEVYRKFFDAACLGDYEAYKSAVNDIDDINLGDDKVVDGASVNWTALHYAVAVGSIDIVRDLLRRKAKIGVKTTGGESLTPMRLAVIQRNVDVLNLLLGVSRKPESGLLCFAAGLGWTDGVKSILTAGADVNEKDRQWKKTPLHIAASEGFSDMFRFLMCSGADVGVVDKMGQTPIEKAVLAENVDAIQLLVEAGVSTNELCSNGDPLLHRAIKAGHPKSALCLLALGASTSIKDGKGMTTKECCAWAIREMEGMDDQKEMRKVIDYL